MSMFFNWAVQHEREHCNEILINQPEYHTNHKNVIMSIEHYSAEPKACHAIHIYTPEESNGRNIIGIHGGGLIAGSVHQNHNFYMSLAEQGFTVYGIEYRLMPEVYFKTQIEDVKDAIRYLAPKIKHDKNFIVADSAGCLLALWAMCFEGYLIDGAWFNSPMFEPHWLMRRGMFGKDWKKSGFGKGLKDPYAYFKHVVPKNVWLTSTVNDPMKKQAIKGAQAWFNTRYEQMRHGDHDYNVINAHEYESQVFNRFILEKMLEV